MNYSVPIKCSQIRAKLIGVRRYNDLGTYKRKHVIQRLVYGFRG